MTRALLFTGDIIYTVDGPFSYRTWIVRPNGAVEEVRPAGAWAPKAGVRTHEPNTGAEPREWLPREEPGQ